MIMVKNDRRWSIWYLFWIGLGIGYLLVERSLFSKLIRRRIGYSKSFWSPRICFRSSMDFGGFADIILSILWRRLSELIHWYCSCLISSNLEIRIMKYKRNPWWPCNVMLCQKLVLILVGSGQLTKTTRTKANGHYETVFIEMCVRMYHIIYL